MEYKGIRIVQMKNKNLLLTFPKGGQSVIGCKKFMNDIELKKIVDDFLKKNSDMIEVIV